MAILVENLCAETSALGRINVQIAPLETGASPTAFQGIQENDE